MGVDRCWAGGGVVYRLGDLDLDLRLPSWRCDWRGGMGLGMGEARFYCLLQTLVTAAVLSASRFWLAGKVVLRVGNGRSVGCSL